MIIYGTSLRGRGRGYVDLSIVLLLMTMTNCKPTVMHWAVRSIIGGVLGDISDNVGRKSLVCLLANFTEVNNCMREGICLYGSSFKAKSAKRFAMVTQMFTIAMVSLMFIPG